MKLIWLGQAGYRIVSNTGTAILIDPYMSDALYCERGEKYIRQVPISKKLLELHTDVLIITHIHADHMDIETLDKVFDANKSIAVMAPGNVLTALRSRYTGENINYMLFEPGVEITLHGILFRAVYACHSDLCPIGVVIEIEGKVICHTGDTMYHQRLKEELPHDADVLMLPVNGKGNNMNCIDAARLTCKLMPKCVMPMHWDMFSAFGCDVNEFKQCFEGTDMRILIPKHYTETEI